MKHILTSAVAIVLSAMVVHAKPSNDDDQKSKDGRSSRAKAHPQAAGRSAAAKPGAGGARHSGPISGAANNAHAVRKPIASEHPTTKRSSHVASHETVNRAVATPAAQRTLANSRSSRTVVDSRRSDSRGASDRRTWDSSREQSWRGYRYFNAPESAYRGWNRGNSYSWNHHRYHWFDGSWVLIDPGYAYDGRSALSAPEGANLVAEVQVELRRAGYHPGPADGVIGGRTQDAIARYQADKGLGVTGRIDRPLLASLGIDS